MIDVNNNLYQYLLIRRKWSLNYADFIRGKYYCNYYSLYYLLNKMAYNELIYIRKNDNFNELWNNFWGSN